MSQKIKDLLNYGLSKKTLSLMTETQINSFHKRLVNESGSVKVKKGTNFEEIKSMTDKGIDVELTEKKSNKSKKNPWAICTSSLSDEFGTSERSDWSKKQMEKYEKCVKGVKKSIKEGKNPFEFILEEQMRSLVSKHISPKMSKSDLIETVKKLTESPEPRTKPKPGVKPDTDTDFDPFINPDPDDQPEANSPAPKTKPKPGVKPDTDTDFDPFINPDPDDQPEANSPEPRTKPKPGVKPDTDTDFDPFINPDPDDQPEAGSKGLNWFLSKVKNSGLIK